MPLPPLINRLTPASNESLESYLSRLGTANYYFDKRQWYVDIIAIKRETHVNYLRSVRVIEQIAEMTMLEPAVVQDMLVHRFAPYLSDLPTQHRQRGDSQELLALDNRIATNWLSSTTNRVRLCPRCWDECRSLKTPWLLRLVTTCPIHNIRLQDVCPSCYMGLQRRQNTCGKCIKHAGPPPQISIEDDQLALTLTRLVWWAIGCTQKAHEETLPANLAPLANMSNTVFLTFLWEMGCTLVRYDSSNPLLTSLPTQRHRSPRLVLRSLECNHIHSVLIAAVEILIDWPVNWFNTLERMAALEVSDQYTRPQNYSRRPSIIGGSNRSLRGRRWAWLWNAALEYISGKGRNTQHWIQRLGVLKRKAHSDVVPLLSKRTASHQLNIHQRTIERLLTAGNLTNSVQVGNRVFFDATEVERVKKRYAQSVGRPELLEWLGISRPTLHKLIQRGLLQPIPSELLPRAREQRFDPIQIEQSLSQLLGSIPVCTSHSVRTKLLDLKTALYALNHTGIDMADLLGAVGEGLLSCVRTSNEIGLKNLRFERRAVIEFRKSNRGNGSTITLSARQTAAFLQIAPQVLSHIRKSKLLLPIIDGESNDFHKWQYRLDDIEQFKQGYVSAKEAAAIIGITQRQVSNWVRMEWLSAASGPNIDGAHVYRFDRQALVKWRHESMVSQQVRDHLGISKRTLQQWVYQGKLVPRSDMPKHPLWFKREDVQKLSLNWLRRLE